MQTCRKSFAVLFYRYCFDFCEKYNLRWRIAVNLAPCSCAGAVEYIVHSCPVLIAKPDLASHCIHRLERSRDSPVDKSNLKWYILYVTENCSI